MSLFTKAARFARSPQGRQAMEKAKNLAKDPKTKAQIEQVRRRVAQRGKP